jgi:hypothetical protein
MYYILVYFLSSIKYRPSIIFISDILGAFPRTVKLDVDQGDVWIGVAPWHAHVKSLFTPYTLGYGWWVGSKFTRIENVADMTIQTPRFILGQSISITLCIDSVEKTLTWTFHTTSLAENISSGECVKDAIVRVQKIPFCDAMYHLTFCLHHNGNRIAIDTNLDHYV